MVPTVKDVAREAGVAVGTVSKVINGKPVGDEYKKKVEAAIKKLDYRINSYAQGLKASKTYTVAVLVPNTANPFFGELAHELNFALSKRNYRMYLCCTDYDFRLEQEFINMVQMNKVDGIIGLTYSPDIVVDESLPFVSIDRPFSQGIPCISSDNYNGGLIAAEKLCELGCRKLVFFRNGSPLINEPNKRASGFEAGCIHNNIDYDIVSVDDPEDPVPTFKKYISDHIKKGKADFDGVFCVTDSLACIIMEMLAEHDIYAPNDIQIIGFDGIKHFATGKPYCSSIAQPIADLAEVAVDTLLRESNSVKPPLICLPVEYLEGPTTKQTR
ncbi:MAG: LacI family DNA-binding transcriptional regulator [Lachnospiraceae bacterium]|nr:LacI family DNA-binding transcriptional regulator [Lachnospiraceae bacterium]